MRRVKDNPALLSQRLLFFTGKGGVGKTLVSAALATNTARFGEKTLWIEMSDQPKSPFLFKGYQPQYQPQLIKENLWAMNLLFRPAIEEYLHLVFRLRWISNRIKSNQLFRIFTSTLPGLYALVTLGKIWHEAGLAGARSWDRIIVDAPATGHGLSWFQLPTTAQQIIKTGPIAERTHDIINMFADTNHTGIIVVSLPEKLVVDETEELIGQMQRKTSFLIQGIIVNKVFPDLTRNDDGRYLAWLNGAEDASIRKILGAEEGTIRKRLSWYQEWVEEQLRLKQRIEQLGIPTINLSWVPTMHDIELLNAIQQQLANQKQETPYA